MIHEADCLLESCDLLANACDIFRRYCVEGIQADEARCRAHVEASTAVVTALLPVLGYERACDVAKRAKAAGKTVREVCINEGLMTEAVLNELTSPEAVCRLGTPDFRGA